MNGLLIAASRAASIVLINSIVGLSQANELRSPPQNDLAIEILSFKIGSDYYPMIDRKNSVFTADNPDFPRPDTERMSPRGGRRSERGARMDDSRSRGKLRTELKVISEAQWINLIVRNASNNDIKAIDWDFAFPRYVDEKIVLRYDVSSKIEIKPNGKKTLKHPLPTGATRCKTIVVDADENQEGKAKVFEAVCGPGVHDPSHLKQETVSIKRIVYMDGSIWQRQREYETNEK
jgi:hypothetical protein